jgi:type VI secretion system protein ImpD
VEVGVTSTPPSPSCDDPRATDLLARLDQQIAAIDVAIETQLNQILHADRFKALEAAWRGIQYLVKVADGERNVKIRLLPLSWVELVRDLERAADFDQSEMFNKIYSGEFGRPGGEPFGLLVGDYYLSHRPGARHATDDVGALKGMAAIAAAAFAPFVAGAAPHLIGLESFRELAGTTDIDAIFRQAEYTRWRTLRESEDVRFVGLCLPRILMRRPWRGHLGRVDGFAFHEAREHDEDHGFLWGNAAFAFAGVAIRAFAQSGWFAEIRGLSDISISSGGLVNDLPNDFFSTDRPDIAYKRALEVAFPDHQEKTLSDLGLIVVSEAEHTPFAMFYGNQSLQAPKRYSDLASSISAQLSAMLQYLLCVGRFAHAIKMIAREKVGSFITAEECQNHLQKWLTKYVTGNEQASLELRVKYPLRGGQVDVRELPGQPGIFKMDIRLRPHLQLDDISTGIRLTTELAPSRAT